MSAIASGKEDLSSDDENKNFKVSQVAFNNKVVEKDPTPSFEHHIVQIQNGDSFKSRFEVCNKLGQGQFAVVHKIKDCENGDTLAAKFVKLHKSEDKKKCLNEIGIMNLLSSPKFVQLVASFEKPNEIIMVMEYIEGGELFEKVVADEFTLTEYDCIFFVRQICKAMEFMHDR
jgi:myosin-light-chain kinase